MRPLRFPAEACRISSSARIRVASLSCLYSSAESRALWEILGDERYGSDTSSNWSIHPCCKAVFKIWHSVTISRCMVLCAGGSLRVMMSSSRSYNFAASQNSLPLFSSPSQSLPRNCKYRSAATSLALRGYLLLWSCIDSFRLERSRTASCSYSDICRHETW